MTRAVTSYIATPYMHFVIQVTSDEKVKGHTRKEKVKSCKYSNESTLMSPFPVCSFSHITFLLGVALRSTD